MNNSTDHLSRCSFCERHATQKASFSAFLGIQSHDEMHNASHNAILGKLRRRLPDRSLTSLELYCARRRCGRIASDPEWEPSMSPFSRSSTTDMIALMIALLAGAALIGQPGRLSLMLSEGMPQIVVATSMSLGQAPLGHAPLGHGPLGLLASRGA